MSPDDNSSFYRSEQIASEFDRYGEREWNRLVETPVDEVSLFIHSYYLQQHITAGMRVLEVGAGAGRFTQVLANLGVRIWVADISPVQLDLNRKYAQAFGFADAIETWNQVDICAMDTYPDSSFDCVVAYGGPFSYVLDRRDAALSESLRVLKPGGLLFISVMSVWGTAHRNLASVLALTPEINQKVTGTGDLTPATLPQRGGNFMHMFRAGELRSWLETHDLAVVAMSASGCISIAWSDLLKSIRQDQTRWQELLRMELEASAEQGALDMGTHLIAIVRRLIAKRS